MALRLMDVPYVRPRPDKPEDKRFEKIDPEHDIQLFPYRFAYKLAVVEYCEEFTTHDP